MKKHIVSVVAVFSFLMIFGAVSTNAQSTGCVTAQIPFPFQAMNREFTEGNYKICPAPAISKMFSLENDNSRAFAFINPLALEWRNADKMPGLVFNRYGNSYFLSEIRTSSLALELQTSKGEKELRRISPKQAGPATVTVALSPARGKRKS